ncbi:MAG TPA: DMT family transporter [Usitatibacter sp.]
MKTNSNGLGAGLLLFATFAWGSLFHVGKSALAHVDPWWFSLARYTGATAVIVAILAATGALRWRLLAPNLGRLAFHGIAGYGVFGIVVFIGLQWTVASHAALIMATMPISTIVARAFLERRVPPSWTWAVAGLALAGVFIVSGAGGSAGGSWHGDAVVFLGSLGWVTYTLGPGALPRLDVREYTAFTMVVALPAIALGVALAQAAGLTHAPSAREWLAASPHIAYTVLIPTVAAALAFNRGVRALGPVNAMLFINMVPVSAMAIGAALGQHPGAPELAGSALVIAAIVLQYRMLTAPPRPAMTVIRPAA